MLYDKTLQFASVCTAIYLHGEGFAFYMGILWGTGSNEYNLRTDERTKKICHSTKGY